MYCFVLYARPIVPFAMGTLGFLTPFDIENLHPVLDRILDEANVRKVAESGCESDIERDDGKQIWSTLRQRLRCEIIRSGEEHQHNPNNKRLVLNDLWIG